ncbi:unnamed protein product [Ectocarpus sp. CCAP 1310/34]|nr:unnamed protein product [Ectocarpus sp. CCAP 1310/34]
MYSHLCVAWMWTGCSEAGTFKSGELDHWKMFPLLAHCMVIMAGVVAAT